MDAKCSFETTPRILALIIKTNGCIYKGCVKISSQYIYVSFVPWDVSTPALSLEYWVELMTWNFLISNLYLQIGCFTWCFRFCSIGCCFMICLSCWKNYPITHCITVFNQQRCWKVWTCLHGAICVLLNYRMIPGPVNEEKKIIGRVIIPYGRNSVLYMRNTGDGYACTLRQDTVRLSKGAQGSHFFNLILFYFHFCWDWCQPAYSYLQGLRFCARQS